VSECKFKKKRESVDCLNILSGKLFKTQDEIEKFNEYKINLINHIQSVKRPSIMFINNLIDEIKKYEFVGKKRNLDYEPHELEDEDEILKDLNNISK
jgi:hypothetical protein